MCVGASRTKSAKEHLCICVVQVAAVLHEAMSFERVLGPSKQTVRNWRGGRAEGAGQAGAAQRPAMRSLWEGGFGI